MRYVRFPGGAVGEVPDPIPAPEPLAELCAKCGFTYYNHESNTGVPYPCWTPSGRYSVDKRTNAPTSPEPLPEMRIDLREEADPMIDSVPPEEPHDRLCLLCGEQYKATSTRLNCPDCTSARLHRELAASPLPEEPRKCPTCGTKLIPAAQAFSEIRERITHEEPPAEHTGAAVFGRFVLPRPRDEGAAASCHLVADVLEAEGAHKHIAPAPLHIENLRYAAAHLRQCSLTPTPAEAAHLLIEMEQLDPRAVNIPGGWTSATLQSALQKLRRLSQSDTPK